MARTRGSSGSFTLSLAPATTHQSICSPGFANDDFTRNLIRWVGEKRRVLTVERPAALLKLVNIP